MRQVIFIKELKIMFTPLFQLERLVKFFQRGTGIGFKIPEGMVKIKKKMLYSLHYRLF